MVQAVMVVSEIILTLLGMAVITYMWFYKLVYQDIIKKRCRDPLALILTTIISLCYLLIMAAAVKFLTLLVAEI